MKQGEDRTIRAPGPHEREAIYRSTGDVLAGRRTARSLFPPWFTGKNMCNYTAKSKRCFPVFSLTCIVRCFKSNDLIARVDNSVCLKTCYLFMIS